MNVQEFKEKHMDGSEVYDAECVYSGPDEVYHKTVSQTSVYKVGEQFFEVTSMRDNSGYWSDGERYEPEVRIVKPVKKMVEITEWEGV
jgi:hypothetical protein